MKQAAAAAAAGCGSGGALSPSDIAKIKRSYVYTRLAPVAFVLGAAMMLAIWIDIIFEVFSVHLFDVLPSLVVSTRALPLSLLALCLSILAVVLFAASRRGVGIAKKKTGIHKERAASARYLECVAAQYGFALPTKGAERATAGLIIAAVVAVIICFGATLATCIQNAGSMTMLREEQAQHVISALENAGIEADAVHRAGEAMEDGHTVVGCLSANRETGDLVCVCVYFNDPFTGDLFDEYKVSDVLYLYSLDQTKTPEENLTLAQQDIELMSEALRGSGAATKNESVFTTPEISEEVKQSVLDGTSKRALFAGWSSGDLVSYSSDLPEWTAISQG